MYSCKLLIYRYIRKDTLYTRCKERRREEGRREEGVTIIHASVGGRESREGGNIAVSVPQQRNRHIYSLLLETKEPLG